MFKDLLRKRSPETLEERDAQYRSDAKNHAKVYASRHLPREGERLEPYLLQIKSSYQAVLSDELRGYAGDSLKLKEYARKALEDKEIILRERLQEAKGKREALKSERDSLAVKDYSTRRNGRLRLLILLFAIGEAYMTSSAFALYDRGNMIAHYILLLVFVALYGYSPYAFVWSYRKNLGKKSLPLVLGAMSAIYLAVNYVFAILRKGYLSNIDKTTLKPIVAYVPMDLHPALFVLISVGFLGIGIILEAQIETREEKISNNRAKEIDKVLPTLENEIAGIQRELDSIPQSLSSNERQYSQRDEQADEMRQKIQAMYRGAVGEFISTLRLLHPNPPSCLEDPIADL